MTSSALIVVMGRVSLRLLTAPARGSVDELPADPRAIRRRGYAVDDEETMEGSSATAWSLEVQATPERVPALIEDLRWLAAEPSDPLGRS